MSKIRLKREIFDQGGVCGAKISVFKELYRNCNLINYGGFDRQTVNQHFYEIRKFIVGGII